ncbi:DOT1-domain-containing protein [Ramicandelaber brevisporus]|nr:DOT1-domain-containing protein [Ramicandelaber brevisporus]
MNIIFSLFLEFLEGGGATTSTANSAVANGTGSGSGRGSRTVSASNTSNVRSAVASRKGSVSAAPSSSTHVSRSPAIIPTATTTTSQQPSSSTAASRNGRSYQHHSIHVRQDRSSVGGVNSVEDVHTRKGYNRSPLPVHGAIQKQQQRARAEPLTPMTRLQRSPASSPPPQARRSTMSQSGASTVQHVKRRKGNASQQQQQQQLLQQQQPEMRSIVSADESDASDYRQHKQLQRQVQQRKDSRGSGLSRSVSPMGQNSRRKPRSLLPDISEMSTSSSSTAAKVHHHLDSTNSASIPAPLPSSELPETDPFWNEGGNTNAGNFVLRTASEAVENTSSVKYTPHFVWKTDSNGKVPEFTELRYPYGPSEYREVFPLVEPTNLGRTKGGDEVNEYRPIADLVGTVENVIRHIFHCPLPSSLLLPDLLGQDSSNGKTNTSSSIDSHGNETTINFDRIRDIPRRLQRAYNMRDGSTFLQIIGEFNSFIEETSSKRSPSSRPQLTATERSDLISHALFQVYSRVVGPNVDQLRNYRAFSDNVYGEINQSLVTKMIQRSGLTKDSVFIDLGCGVGNVVLQVAAQVGCRCFGVEIMKSPAKLAQEQIAEFRNRMRLYGLGHGPMRVENADMLDCSALTPLLAKADVVLCNNYAFGADLNNALAYLLLDLKEGARVISLRSFVPVDHRITPRNISSPASIFRVSRHTYSEGDVSWTNSGGKYFMQVVDRSRIQKVIDEMGSKSGSQSHSPWTQPSSPMPELHR